MNEQTNHQASKEIVYTDEKKTFEVLRKTNSAKMVLMHLQTQKQKQIYTLYTYTTVNVWLICIEKKTFEIELMGVLH